VIARQRYGISEILLADRARTACFCHFFCRRVPTIGLHSIAQLRVSRTTTPSSGSPGHWLTHTICRVMNPFHCLTVSLVAVAIRFDLETRYMYAMTFGSNTPAVPLKYVHHTGIGTKPRYHVAVCSSAPNSCAWRFRFEASLLMTTRSTLMIMVPKRIIISAWILGVHNVVVYRGAR
jgi:hypothetical protein